MTETLPLFTLEQLYLQPITPQPFVVDGLLTPGLYILGGSPKTGKSWMALQLCLAVCGGQPFLGRSTQKSEVLYFALEDSPRRLHSRALHLADTAPQGLHLCTQASPLGHGLEQQLEAILHDKPDIRLVIIDTLQKIRRPSAAGATYSSDYQDAAALKALADRHGVCMLLIHHLRKLPDDDPMNRLSGTTGLTGAADGTLILVRESRQSNTAVLTATGRDIEDLSETLDFSDCRWQRVTSPERLQSDLILGPLQKLLRRDGAFTGTATELAERLGNDGALVEPSRLSKYIQSHEELLVEAGIQIETRRTSSKRTLKLWINRPDVPGDRNDTNDGTHTPPNGAAPAVTPVIPVMAS